MDEEGLELKELRATLLAVVTTWTDVVAVCEAPGEAEDEGDPYFALSLDVYYRGVVPPSDERRLLFEGAGVFESRHGALKDRFFLGAVPVRLEYKHTGRIDEVLRFTPDVVWDHRRTGTYGLYRLAQGTVLYSSGPWLDSVRATLAEVPLHFWEALKTNWVPTMEHALIDMKASTARGDDFFFLQSLAVFLRTLVSLLFVINRKFEPSARLLPARLESLSCLPERFRLYFDSLLSQDPDLTGRRKCEVAELLARSVFGMRIHQHN